MQNISPLRYPGGKSKMFKQVVSIIKTNNLTGCTYIEPFAGGAAVAFGLLYSDIATRIVINDLDPGIYSFWYSVINHHRELIQKIHFTPVTIDERENQIRIYNDPSSSLLDKGFATFYLNRTNRSGIILGGPIGGFDQDSDYKVDCRYNKQDLINRINKIYTYRDQIVLYNLDAKVLIDTIVSEYASNSFVFFDPPYFIKGSCLYFSYFKDTDHLELRDAIEQKMSEIPYIVTYDNVKQIKAMYTNFNQIEYTLSYSAGKKGIGKEVLFFKPNLLSVSLAATKNV